MYSWLSAGCSLTTYTEHNVEDRVIASLTRDKNKCGIFTQNLDGHSLGAVSYFPDKVAKEMDLTGDIPTDAKKFKELVDGGNKTLKALRQEGKGVTLTNKRLYTVTYIENHINAGNSRQRQSAG